MKRSIVALILGFLVLSFCPAQTQTGNASFNPSKGGLAISHASLSFNTHVRVTNLRNNRSVEAIVNNRIPISAERIADISREAGALLGMEPSGFTPVEIEVIRGGETVPVVLTPAPPEPEPRSPGTAAPQPAPPPPAGGEAGESEEAEDRTSPPPRILPLQTVTDIQYVPVPAPSNCCTPLLWVILLLLLLVIIILTVILALLLRHLLLWPWHYRVWYRRHLLYAKRRRRETAP